MTTLKVNLQLDLDFSLSQDRLKVLSDYVTEVRVELEQKILKRANYFRHAYSQYGNGVNMGINSSASKTDFGNHSSYGERHPPNEQMSSFDEVMRGERDAPTPPSPLKPKPTRDTWVDKHGAAIKVVDMENRHLVNCVKYLRRWAAACVFDNTAFDWTQGYDSFSQGRALHDRLMAEDREARFKVDLFLFEAKPTYIALLRELWRRWYASEKIFGAEASRGSHIWELMNTAPPMDDFALKQFQDRLKSEEAVPMPPKPKRPSYPDDEDDKPLPRKRSKSAAKRQRERKKYEAKKRRK